MTKEELGKQIEALRKECGKGILNEDFNIIERYGTVLRKSFQYVRQRNETAETKNKRTPQSN